MTQRRRAGCLSLAALATVLATLASDVPAGRDVSTSFAAVEASNRKVDLDNVRLWRFNTKRMEAEVVRMADMVDMDRSHASQLQPLRTAI